MSALAEALVAAQRRALSATEKAYVAGFITHADAVAELNAFGLTDQVDIDFLEDTISIGCSTCSETQNVGSVHR